MGKKVFKKKEKSRRKTSKIIFEKLTVKQEAKIVGAGSDGTVCEKPVESDCAFNQ